MPAPTPSIRRRTRETPDVRREQILDAATGVFLDRGIGSATMADIAGAAGIAKGTVYLYFESKEDLVAGLQARYAREMIRLSERLEAAPPGARLTAFRRFVERVVDYHLEHRDSLRILFHDSAWHEHQVTERFHEALVRFIELGTASEEFRVGDPELTARFLLEGVHGVLNTAFHAPAPDRRRMVFTLSDLSERVLGA